MDWDEFTQYTIGGIADVGRRTVLMLVMLELALIRDRCEYKRTVFNALDSWEWGFRPFLIGVTGNV